MMRERLDAITGGAPIAPLVVLFGLNLVDELDRIAFGVLGPEIGDTFGLDDGDVIVIATLVRIAALAAVLPVVVPGRPLQPRAARRVRGARRGWR